MLRGRAGACDGAGRGEAGQRRDLERGDQLPGGPEVGRGQRGLDRGLACDGRLAAEQPHELLVQLRPRGVARRQAAQRLPVRIAGYLRGEPPPPPLPPY